MSEKDENMENNNFAEDEASLEEFLEPDNYNGDKIILQKKPKRTVTIIKPDNNSGMGEAAPYNVSRKYNWGAFLFNWIWGIKYKRWTLMLVPLLCFIKFGFLLSLILAFYAGTKGNQWAWEEFPYKDEEDFHNSQKAWVKAWFIFAAIFLAISLPIVLIYNKNQKNDGEEKLAPISDFSSLELTIPAEIYNYTTAEDNHADILSSKKHVIYWVRPKNVLTEKNKEDLEQIYNNANDKIKENFVLYPDLKALKEENVKVVNLELEANCVNKTCIDEWLYNNCNKGYCIINPKIGKYYKVRGKSNVIPKALRVISKWK